jgi:hypothetical protein
VTESARSGWTASTTWLSLCGRITDGTKRHAAGLLQTCAGHATIGHATGGLAGRGLAVSIGETSAVGETSSRRAGQQHADGNPSVWMETQACGWNPKHADGTQSTRMEPKARGWNPRRF